MNRHVRINHTINWSKSCQGQYHSPPTLRGFDGFSCIQAILDELNISYTVRCTSNCHRLVRFVPNKNQAGADKNYYCIPGDFTNKVKESNEGNFMSPNTCPSCNAELNSDFRFCPSCGYDLKKPIFCPNCQYSNEGNSKFCQECGTARALTSGPERRWGRRSWAF